MGAQDADASMPPAENNTASAAPATVKAGNKRRAPMSCDRCKSRKTKCVDPVPGPCQFCASIGADCHLDPSRRRQRPYYHVSEEEFRYMTKALEHFLPNVELNLQTLREVVQSFEQLPPGAPLSNEHPPPYSAPSEASSDSIVVMNDADSRMTPVPSTASNSSVSNTGSASSASSASSISSVSSVNGGGKSDDNPPMTLQEIDELHGELGWLRVDSRGTFRYVGADSGYGFHAAVRSLRRRLESAGDGSGSGNGAKNDIMPPFSAAPPLPPPSTPDSSSAVTAAAMATGGVPSPRLSQPPLYTGFGPRRLQIFLPRRDLCNRCVSRFFRDIQAMYWFWSAERFYAVLDRLYAGDPSSATPATLCSLYSMLALTCDSEAQKAQQAQADAMAMGAGGADLLPLAADPAVAGPPPAAKYLSLAKALVPALCDEADTDSVRALCLLGLALQSSMYNNTAYIYIGAAVRIALTLGLHLQRAIEPKGCLQRQVDLRLYSTLYLLDLDIALCYGNPPAITDDDHATCRPHGLAEQILSPGSHMPLDYLTVSCQLVQIKRRLSKLLYGRLRLSASAAGAGSMSASTPAATASNGASSNPSSSALSSSASASTTASGASSSPPPPPRVSVAAVLDSLAALRAWYASIPPHLRDVSRAATFHQRSVSVLLLRYWSVTIFATRPFLLYSALHPDAYAALPAAKRASFDEFCTTCVDAAKQSLAVINVMREGNLLSSLTTLDTGCIIEVLQVLLLALPTNRNGGSGGSDAGTGGSPGTAIASDYEDTRVCLRTLQEMEQILWTTHALTEVMAQLDENGLLNGDNSFSPQPGPGLGTPGTFFLDINQQQHLHAHQQQQQMQHHQAQQQAQQQAHQQAHEQAQQMLLSGVMEAYFSDLQDPFFSVHDDAAAAAAGPMLGDHFQDSLAQNGGLTM